MSRVNGGRRGERHAKPSPVAATTTIVAKACVEASCTRCASDQKFLRRKTRPKAPTDGAVLRAVDLFAGCGGMSLGLEEAARRHGVAMMIALAVDCDEDVLGLYEANFPDATAFAADIAATFESKPGSRLSVGERKVAKAVGDCDVLLGGPPCEGHSSLNNHTRWSDPKNGLYLSMARAAEVLQPKVVIIENVAQVQRDLLDVVGQTKKALEAAEYLVHGDVIDLRSVGVPQRRRRYLLIASRVAEVDPASTLEAIKTSMPDHPDRSVRWAIGDLEDFDRDTVYDTASTPSPDNVKRMAHLFAKDLQDLPNARRPKCHRDVEHSYKSMYGRLWWDKPAQTITTGFGSMGQGRYVHPSRQRTITPHEAARLQTFPDWFDFGKDTVRGILAKAIGNAVPPLLMVDLGAAIVPALVGREQRRESTRA